jgi:hypothetical protein
VDIIEVAGAHERAVEALVEKMVQAILTVPQGYITTTNLRKAAGGNRDVQGEALEALKRDARVEMREEKVPTGIDNKMRKSKVWRPAAGSHPEATDTSGADEICELCEWSVPGEHHFGCAYYRVTGCRRCSDERA